MATRLEDERQCFLDVVGRWPSPSHIDENGWTDLHCAALLNMPGLAEALEDAGLSVDQRLKGDKRQISDELLLTIRPYLMLATFRRIGSTPLHLAAWGNAVDALAWLVAKSASISAKDDYGDTPLPDRGTGGTGRRTTLPRAHGRAPPSLCTSPPHSWDLQGVNQIC